MSACICSSSCSSWVLHGRATARQTCLQHSLVLVWVGPPLPSPQTSNLASQMAKKLL